MIRPKPLLRFPIAAALTVVACAACDASEPAAPGAQTSQAVSDSTFVAALRTRLEAATNADEFSGAVFVARDGRTLFERPARQGGAK